MDTEVVNSAVSSATKLVPPVGVTTTNLHVKLSLKVTDGVPVTLFCQGAELLTCDLEVTDQASYVDSMQVSRSCVFFLPKLPVRDAAVVKQEPREYDSLGGDTVAASTRGEPGLYPEKETSMSDLATTPTILLSHVENQVCKDNGQAMGQKFESLTLSDGPELQGATKSDSDSESDGLADDSSNAEREVKAETTDVTAFDPKSQPTLGVGSEPMPDDVVETQGEEAEESSRRSWRLRSKADSHAVKTIKHKWKQLDPANTGTSVAEKKKIVKIGKMGKTYIYMIKCNVCSYPVKGPSEKVVLNRLQAHQVTKHGLDTGEKHQCPKCPKSWSSELLLRQHIIRVHNDPLVDCPVEGCHKKIRRYYMKLHQQKVHLNKSSRSVHRDSRQARKSYTTEVAEFREEKYRGLFQHELETDSWRCTTCNLVRSSAMAIKIHINGKHLKHADDTKDKVEATVPRPFTITCELCDHVVKRPSKKSLMVAMQGHKASKHGISTGEVHQCPECPKFWPTKLMLRRHMEKVHENPTIECPVAGCSAKFKSHNLLGHQKTMHPAVMGIPAERVKRNKITYPQPQRSWNRQSKTMLLSKFREEKYQGWFQHQPETDTWVCTSCSFIATSEKSVKLHIHGTHFQNADALEAGDPVPRTDLTAAIHALKTRYEMACKICGHRVKETSKKRTLTALQGHQASKHGIDTGETYQCPKCPKTWPTPLMLQRHISKVHDDPLVSCPVEGCTARVKSCNLKLHKQKMHSQQVQSRICHLCGRTFHSRQTYEFHVKYSKAHAQERRFPCSWPACDKAFLTKGGLKQHELLHTGEMPHQCELCGYRAVQVSTMTYHKKRHHPEAYGELPPRKMQRKKTAGRSGFEESVKSNSGW